MGTAPPRRAKRPKLIRRHVFLTESDVELAAHMGEFTKQTLSELCRIGLRRLMLTMRRDERRFEVEYERKLKAEAEAKAATSATQSEPGACPETPVPLETSPQKQP